MLSCRLVYHSLQPALLVLGAPLSPLSLPPCPSSLPCPAVIKDFCKQLGADTKQVQGLIRLAKKNGEKLGFLA